MSDKPPLTPEEREEFRRHMRCLKSIETPTNQSNESTTSQTHIDLPSMTSLADRLLADEYCGADDTITFARPGPTLTKLRKLKQGKSPIEAKIDLHQHTLEDAEQTLGEFINRSIDNNFTTVLVVHGKGANSRARLKNAVNQWLRLHPAVLAFHSARSQHGGAGAIYVLLKRGT